MDFTVDGKTLLQVNATLLTGMLVFLTLTSIFPTIDKQNYRSLIGPLVAGSERALYFNDLANRGVILFFLAILMLPFVISSYDILNGKIKQAIYYTKIGFILLILIVAVFGVVGSFSGAIGLITSN